MSLAPVPAGVMVEGLEMRFGAGPQAVAALAGVSLSVAPGEFVCLVGPSGCGKSTLLKLIAGLHTPSRGRVQITGAAAPGAAVPGAAVPGAAARPPTALVFQEHGLFPWMTLLDNVAFGLEAHGVPRGERRARAADLLAQFGLDGFAAHYPRQLSVGMRQRAAIARALLVSPRLLLMDEPFSALDAQSKLLMQAELLRLSANGRQTVLYVTHDIEEAVLLGDRVLVMSGRPGRIKEELHIPLARPRNLHDRDNPLVREITWHIWKAIEGQVRQELHLPG